MNCKIKAPHILFKFRLFCEKKLLFVNLIELRTRIVDIQNLWVCRGKCRSDNDHSCFLQIARVVFSDMEGYVGITISAADRQRQVPRVPMMPVASYIYRRMGKTFRRAQREVAEHSALSTAGFRCFVDSLFRDCSTDQRYRREVCTAL